MRIAVTGATGMIGRTLIAAVRDRGDDAVALTRSPDGAHRVLGGDVELHAWPEPKQAPPPQAALSGADAVVHLLGEPVAQRWSDEAKREIRDSRVLTTRWLVQGLAELPDDRRPATLVCQSASGYYGSRGAEPLSEDTPGDASGDDFLADVTAAWEHEALAATALSGVRVVRTRTGVVLSPSGGALAKMLPPFRLGLGGPVAGGRQYVPWVHLEDVVGALLHCLDDRRAGGPVNVSAPNPATNAELSRALGRVLHRPAVLPVPGVALRLLYGEMASMVLTGQRALPERLIELGYAFRHPELEQALRDVLTG
ncbi:MAG: TIGR01777 family oxidoreductase [Solirubrobacteraceae bacterium]